MNAAELLRLIPAIRAAWDATTSVDSRWSPDNPALGQCAVTALVVQDALGGSLLRATVGDVSHYWNKLADGSEVDLTREQFASFTPEGTTERDRAYVLSYPATVERYERLRQRVDTGLGRS